MAQDVSDVLAFVHQHSDIYCMDKVMLGSCVRCGSIICGCPCHIVGKLTLRSCDVWLYISGDFECLLISGFLSPVRPHIQSVT